jgi:hypothetical protein
LVLFEFCHFYVPLFPLCLYYSTLLVICQGVFVKFPKKFLMLY